MVGGGIDNGDGDQVGSGHSALSEQILALKHEMQVATASDGFVNFWGLLG